MSHRCTQVVRKPLSAFAAIGVLLTAGCSSEENRIQEKLAAAEAAATRAEAAADRAEKALKLSRLQQSASAHDDQAEPSPTPTEGDEDGPVDNRDLSEVVASQGGESTSGGAAH